VRPLSDVNEVIQKIVSQEGTTENLIALTKENQSKIELLNDQKRKLKARVEEIKYSGVGGGHRRKMVDDHEDQLANSAARLERSRLKYERLNKNLISMKAGIGHLQEKLESVREEVGGRRVELTDEGVVDVLRESELVLLNLTKRIKAAHHAAKREKMLGMEDLGLSGSGVGSGSGKPYRPDSSARIGSAEDIDESEISNIRPYNRRILLSLDDGGDAAGNSNGGGAYGGDLPDMPELDEEELTRDKVKRVSKQITEAIDKKRKKPKKKMGGSGGVGAGERLSSGGGMMGLGGMTL